MTTPTYALLGTSLLVRVCVSHAGKHADGSHDATPLVILLSLVLTGIIHGRDPLETYGLSKLALFGCPWKALFLLWSAAFFVGRLSNALLLRMEVGIGEVSTNGTMNPGGVYMSLKGYPKFGGLILGLPMVFSQTFMEEFIFRGLFVQFGTWFFSLFEMLPYLANYLSIISSAILFGLIHFIPAICCLKGKSIAIPLYALIMPTTLGIIFSVLNLASCSLWPGWIVHFGLNYAVFVWDRISGKWETRGVK